MEEEHMDLDLPDLEKKHRRQGRTRMFPKKKKPWDGKTRFTTCPPDPRLTLDNPSGSLSGVSSYNSINVGIGKYVKLTGR